MTGIVLSPLTGGSAIELGGGLWRKKLLPVGNISYKGRTLHFTADYLARLADAFRDHAYDSVPLQLADKDNAHTNAVERYAGEIIDADVAADGLYVTVRPTDRGQQLLSENPKLGVSARIVEDYARADGKFYPAAIQHVLATHDPRITGLGGWQQVDMANYATAGILDLSSYEWAGEGGYPAGTEKLVPLLDLPDVEFDAMLAAIQSDTHFDYATFEREIMADIDAHPEEYGIETANPCALANDYDGLHNVIELADRADAFEAQRRREDAMPLARGTENRLEQAFSRIQSGSYLPTSPLVQLAGDPSSAGRSLARARWSQAEAGSVTGHATCGPADEMGYCRNDQHDPECGSLADPAIGEVLGKAGGVYQALASAPWADANGRVWANHAGTPMDLVQHVEASTGVQLMPNAGGPFDNSGRELIAPQRIARYGDYDDPDGAAGAIDLPDVSALAQVIGVAGKDVAADRVRAGLQRDQAAADFLLHGGRSPREAFDMGSRRQAVKDAMGPVQIAPLGDNGESAMRGVPQYTIGAIREELGI